jgi:hypothetical protein
MLDCHRLPAAQPTWLEPKLLNAPLKSADQTALLEHSLNELEREKATVQELMKTAGLQVKNLAGWRGESEPERPQGTTVFSIP